MYISFYIKHTQNILISKFMYKFQLSIIEKDVKVSVNDLVIKAVGLSLQVRTIITPLLLLLLLL